MSAQNAEDSANRYGIGVVSRLTGISRDALRVWERRYGVVTAQRTETKRRLYSQDDIKRLMLVKALVDSGHQISSVANLSTKNLEARLKTDAVTQPIKPTGLHERPVRVLMVGPSLVRLSARNGIGVDGLEIVAAVSGWHQLDRHSERVKPDVLVIERAGLFDDTVEEAMSLLREWGARRMILVYGFASRNAVVSIRKNAPMLIAIRAPVNTTELRLACLMDVKTGPSTPGTEAQKYETPGRVFTEEQLGALAIASSTVKCECLQHLVSLVSNLSAFEDYSEACESRNAADASLHAHLHSVTAQSRRLIEDALAAVAAAEGIPVKPASAVSE